MHQHRTEFVPSLVVSALEAANFPLFFSSAIILVATIDVYIIVCVCGATVGFEAGTRFDLTK